MSIPSATAPRQPASSSAPPPPEASGPPSRPTPTADAAGAPDAALREPRPLRFPWLSRLSIELAPAAPQKPAFATAPVLGEFVDRAV